VAGAGAGPGSDTSGPYQMQKPGITPTLIVGAWRVTIGQYRMAWLRVRAKIIPTGRGTDEGSEERASAALAAPRRPWPGASRVPLAADRAL